MVNKRNPLIVVTGDVYEELLKSKLYPRETFSDTVERSLKALKEKKNG